MKYHCAVSISFEHKSPAMSCCLWCTNDQWTRSDIRSWFNWSHLTRRLDFQLYCFVSSFKWNPLSIYLHHQPQRQISRYFLSPVYFVRHPNLYSVLTPFHLQNTKLSFALRVNVMFTVNNTKSTQILPTSEILLFHVLGSSLPFQDLSHTPPCYQTDV